MGFLGYNLAYCPDNIKAWYSSINMIREAFASDWCIIDIDPITLLSGKMPMFIHPHLNEMGNITSKRWWLWYLNYSLKMEIWSDNNVLTYHVHVLLLIPCGPNKMSENLLSKVIKIRLREWKCLGFACNLLKCVAEDLNGTWNLFHYCRAIPDYFENVIDTNRSLHHKMKQKCGYQRTLLECC